MYFYVWKDGLLRTPGIWFSGSISGYGFVCVNSRKYQNFDVFFMREKSKAAQQNFMICVRENSRIQNTNDFLFRNVGL